MNFFFGVNQGDIQSKISIPKFQNSGKFNRDNLLYSASIVNSKWFVKKEKTEETESFFKLKANEIDNHKIFFIATEQEVSSYFSNNVGEKLEDLNNAPRISQKVRGVDRDKVPKRKSLKKFKPFLDIENPNKICFLTDKPIANNELSIDHIIPWSYMYSDDLWNLVYVSKSRNCSKSNRLPSEDLISKLEQRNKKLLQELCL